MVKAYDPGTGVGAVVTDSDRAEVALAPGALSGSIFRMLRQGQRVVFDLDEKGRAIRIRTGAEVDMGSPTPPPGAFGGS